MHIHIKHLYTLDVTSKQLSKNSNGDRAEYELIQLLYLLMLPINRKKKTVTFILFLLTLISLIPRNLLNIHFSLSA